MKFTRHEVYNYIYEQVNTTSRPVYITGRIEPIPPSFPAIYLVQLSTEDYAPALNLLSTDSARRVVWEAQIFTNKTTGAVDEAHEIMEDVSAAFKNIGFQLTYCYPVENADPSIYRLVMRVERLVCGGDTADI